MTLYLDGSAVVKLVRDERETCGLRRRLEQTPVHSSSLLLQVEVLRAVETLGVASVGKARQILREITLLDLDRWVAEQAATLRVEPFLRSLEAIHVATARRLGADLTALITYDRRIADAARQLALPVESPA